MTNQTFVHIHPHNLTHEQLVNILDAGWIFYSVHSLTTGGQQWDFYRPLAGK
jgi:hypothetical protein